MRGATKARKREVMVEAWTRHRRDKHNTRRRIGCERVKLDWRVNPEVGGKNQDEWENAGKGPRRRRAERVIRGEASHVGRRIGWTENAWKGAKGRASAGRFRAEGEMGGV